MNNSTLRRNLGLVTGSVMAGLAIAFLANRMLPQRSPAEPVREFVAPDGNSAVAALTTPGTQGSENLQAGAPPAALTAGITTDMDALLAPVSSYASAVRASAPAVVSIYTLTKVAGVVQRLPNGATRQLRAGQTLEGLGSGVIVDAEGHIITNDHVIKDADQIQVQLADGRVAEAMVLGRDPETELAVLKIDLPQLPVIKLGRADRLAVGDVVLAIGNPFGLSQTVTHGIVSFISRGGLNLATYENFIQTDAAINHGNSGGALVNARGELIGINTAVLGQEVGAEGLGLAIPVDLVRGVMSDILQYKQVMRGWLGIKFADATEAYARQEGLPYTGVVVYDMDPRSPALPAALARFDKIDTVDGQGVRNARDALARIANRKPGSPVKITGMRGTQPFAVSVTVIKPPEIPRKDATP